MIIAGMLFIFIGITIRPLIGEFWHPGIAGAPTPKGWRGCMNVLVTPFAVWEIVVVSFFKIPSYVILIGGGGLLLVYSLTSRLALSLPFVYLSMGTMFTFIFVEWIRVSQGRFCRNLCNALADRVPASFRYMRGIRDNTRTLVTFRSSDYIEGAVAALQWLPPSTEGGPERLASAKATAIIIWKAEEAAKTALLKNKKIHPLESAGVAYRGTTDVAVSPDGLYTAFSDRIGHVYVHKNNVPSGTSQRALLEQNIINLTQDEAALESNIEKTSLVNWLRREDTLFGVNAVTWSPSRPYRLAFGANDSTVKVWYIGETIYERREHASSILTSFSFLDPTARQYLALVYHEHKDIVTDVAWSPDGESIASTSADATVRIWNAGTGQTTRVYKGHTGAVYALSWSPDGSQMATASEDGGVHVWNVRTGEKMIEYRGHQGEVLAVCWSPDGTCIASAGQDKTVQVWNVSSGQIQMTYWTHRKKVLTVAWSLNGQYLASGGEDGTIRVWQKRRRR